MSEWLLYIMGYAAQLSGYPYPDSLPEVRWESESWFSHRACKDHMPFSASDLVFILLIL